MQLFRDDLRERRADVLADFGLSRVNTDLAVFSDVKPRRNISRRRRPASAASAAARLLKSMCRAQEMNDQDTPAQRLQESAAIQLEWVTAILEQLVALCLEFGLKLEGRVR